MTKIEYRVRPVVRYVVTKFHEGNNRAGVETCGEFDNEVMASNAVLAFGDAETINAEAPDIVVTRRPMPGPHEQVRTWHRGKGWDDCPVEE